MAKNRILIIWSNYYEDLAKKQLDNCTQLLDRINIDYQIEKVEAGTYEIPVVMNHYHRTNPFDGYIPLSLLLKGKTDHYEFIWEHVKECFIQFALDGLLMGNGVITAPSKDLLIERVENGERVKEAVDAVTYLMKFKNNIINANSG